jgi:LytS/YehU family sensor histidine kinase
MELRNRQLEQERASKFALEAQLASLESHIRPHFLFNTLNTISSLIPEDPGLAEHLVGKLAALLRLSLDSNQERLASLERELKIVGDYLEIERARYGSRLRFKSDVPAELRAVEVPALSLQTLVENSVKYAVGSRFEGAEIRLGASAHNGSLIVNVSDDGPGFNIESFPPGHGLDNLQRRLTVLFGPSARLEVSNDSGARVCFTIPLTAV